MSQKKGLALIGMILSLSTLALADPPAGYPNPIRLGVDAWMWHGDVEIQCDWVNDHLWWGSYSELWPWDDNVQLTLVPILDTNPPQIDIRLFEQDANRSGQVYSWPGIGTWTGDRWMIEGADGTDMPLHNVPEPGALALVGIFGLATLRRR